MLNPSSMASKIAATLVVVGNQGIEIDTVTLRVDEGARIEQEGRQNRSSATRLRRSSAVSLAQPTRMPRTAPATMNAIRSST